MKPVVLTISEKVYRAAFTVGCLFVLFLLWLFIEQSRPEPHWKKPIQQQADSETSILRNENNMLRQQVAQLEQQLRDVETP